MPELPEVETVRKGLESNLIDYQIKAVQVLSDRSIASDGGTKIFEKSLPGLTIGRWSRRGKYLISSLVKKQNQLKTINAGHLIVHLRMTGYFKLCNASEKCCNHTRVRFWNHHDKEIRFIDIRNFGQLWFLPPSNVPEKDIKGIKSLGPEPLCDEFNEIYLKNKISKRKCSIKSALLNQSIIAGIGNIYADESLFEAKILPYKSCNKLTNKEYKKLSRSIKNVLKISIGKGGTTFSDFRDLEGLNGNYGGHAWVYRRTDQPCKKCNFSIKRQKICGRSTHWCPKCQN